MAKLAIKKASTDVTTYVFIQDSSKTTGEGLAGLAYNTGSLVGYYVRPKGSATAITLATQTVTGAHSDGGFVEVDATNMPGVYRLDLPDAVCATGVNSAVVMLKGAANMAPVLLEIQLTDFDLNDASPNVTVADIATDAITAAALKADAVTKIQSGLATPTNITAGTITTVTNLTNLPTMPTDWVTAAGLKADAVTEIQSGLATAAALDAVDNFIDTEVAAILAAVDTEVAAILADTNELQTDLVDGGRLDLLIDGIKAKTDTITAAPTAASVADAVWDEAIVDHSSVGSFGAKNQKVVPSETVGDYKADVSLLALAADLQDVEDKIDVIATDTTTEIPATLATLATSAALATVDTNVDSVLADTNEIQAELADGGRTDLLIDSIVDATTATGVLLKDDAIEAIFNDVVVTGTYNFSDLLKIMASALAGKLSGGGTTTLTFRGVDDTSDVIVATVDANGNRSALTLKV